MGKFIHRSVDFLIGIDRFLFSSSLFHSLTKGKPCGLRTARKLKDHRREQRWHDKDYKKSHLGTRWKSNPFAGASHAKGIVLEKVYVPIERCVSTMNGISWDMF
jgi:hypothetical protein